MKKQIYKALDVLTAGKGFQRNISGFKLRIPVGYHNYFESYYELNNINFINNYLGEGMKVIDIGAHIGLLSVIMAQKVKSTGKVYSFEPTPSTFRLLQKTIAINNSAGIIQPNRLAVAEKRGKTFFYVTDIEAHNSNSLANNKRNYGNEHKIDVELTSVDEFVLDHKISKIDFIKIDAEGAEYSVLKGCETTLRRDKPKMILALHPLSIVNFGNSLGEIWDYLQTFGYTMVYKSEKIDRDFFIRQDDLFDVFLLDGSH
ncbi:MAG TPA: FkbM family methyltransferase [Chitinophagaceae bacterium]|nr:FkbM family methyltransferase [Chitinophagaceae bacterium]